ncbi:MAG TPA: gliding motility protein GldC [Chitinophagaceae bacterium]|nr:gliding motility protein GldC [Chitinophagaceae bacterium]
MNKSTIRIDVTLDDQRMPEQISWNASDTTAEEDRIAKAIMLSLWDGADRSALRIDLWTKAMMVDEMADFFYQTFMTMADTYERATRNQELSNDVREFAKKFYTKFRDQQLKEGKL